MVFSPAFREAASTFAVVATALWTPSRGTPSLSNSPPFEPKSFCRSMTSIAVRAGSISTGLGFASILNFDIFFSPVGSFAGSGATGAGVS